MTIDFYGLPILIDSNRPIGSINIDLSISFPMIDFDRLVTPGIHSRVKKKTPGKQRGRILS